MATTNPCGPVTVLLDGPNAETQADLVAAQRQAMCISQTSGCAPVESDTSQSQNGGKTRKIRRKSHKKTRKSHKKVIKNKKSTKSVKKKKNRKVRKYRNQRK